ncbi:sialin [Anabrus simplex]|uniref:sialin n=1 Tax=Anabrus simplex TaxID=316456 RepID=UPI0035A3BFBC
MFSECHGDDTTSHPTAATIAGRIKRGSVQIQQAGIKASGRIGTRAMMAFLVMWAMVLQGLVQHSATVTLMALSDPLSSEDFAEYVANTSYVTRYCRPLNESLEAEASEEEPPRDEEDYEDDALLADNDTAHSGHHTRHIVAEPDLKVPLSEEDSIDSIMREAFLWGSFLSPLPASFLAAKIGPKRVMGGGILGAGALVAFVPFAWFTAYHMLIRVAQGILIGATWPALHMLGASWYPSLQRTGFVCYYSAVSVGYAAVGLVGTRVVQLVGRDWLCYVLTVLTVLWFLAWYQMVHDCPADHPRLSAEQRQRLLIAVGPGLASRQAVPPVPWKRLMLSGPVWACSLANLGSQWGQATLHLAVTKYLKLVYGFSLTYDRILSVLPHLGHFMAAILFGMVVDHARANDIVSTTTSRKFLVYLSHFPVGAILFIVGYSGCDPSAPAALFTAAVVISGATAAGTYASAIDVAPNYAGYVFGLSQTLGAAGSLAGSYVIAEGLHGSLPGSWRLVFGVAALVLAVTAMLFMAIGSGSAQPWNSLPLPESPDEPLVPAVTVEVTLDLDRETPGAEEEQDTMGEQERAENEKNDEQRVEVKEVEVTLTEQELTGSKTGLV